ncbi:nuclear transport factor 2 family protein [Halobacterium bonnevillei]|uniref:SnoaL-like domain-containing protein n=1 Tax=Halobacterium bonnevillei TaxID=2692200 RepID=A0A6B0SJU6_9EURY|nr:nuclear transport factor 2 family protein [Halobacterium bonnevillei]MXR19140.1 hypothetical protein [Halobacterium bonnevillei]
MADGSHSAPETVVQRQTESYNDGDIAAFASYYAKEAEITTFGEIEVIAVSRDGIRDEYGQLFEAVPGLHAEVVAEFTVREYVATKERVTGVDGPCSDAPMWGRIAT